MAKFKNAAVVLTATETARQWARNNPDKAGDYIDKATGFIDRRTKHKYHKQLGGLSRTVKKNVTGVDTVRGSAVHDAPPAPKGDTPFPDLRM